MARRCPGWKANGQCERRGPGRVRGCSRPQRRAPPPSSSQDLSMRSHAGFRLGGVPLPMSLYEIAVPSARADEPRTRDPNTVATTSLAEAWGLATASRARSPDNPRSARERDPERLWPPVGPSALLRGLAGYRGALRRDSRGQRRGERTPANPVRKSENAAEVSRRRSLKTKGPVAFATGPAIAGAGFEPATFGL